MTERTLIVPVSGGKDSQVCLSLAKQEWKGPMVAVHQSTGYDHPDTYQQLRDMEAFYGVKVMNTVSVHGDMFGFLEFAGYFPNDAARGCTQELKQKPFARWLLDEGFTPDNCEIWFGMRGTDESAARSGKYGGLEGGDVFALSDISPFYGEGWRKPLGPIEVRLRVVDWTTEQIFDHILSEGAPLNPLYGRGATRVGCYPCLLTRKADWVQAGTDPVGREHIIKLIRLKDKWALEGNPRKLSRSVHKVWDVSKFLDAEGAAQLRDLKPDECGWCSI